MLAGRTIPVLVELDRCAPRLLNRPDDVDSLIEAVAEQNATPDLRRLLSNPASARKVVFILDTLEELGWASRARGKADAPAEVNAMAKVLGAFREAAAGTLIVGMSRVALREHIRALGQGLAEFKFSALHKSDLKCIAVAHARWSGEDERVVEAAADAIARTERLASLPWTALLVGVWVRLGFFQDGRLTRRDLLRHYIEHVITAPSHARYSFPGDPRPALLGLAAKSLATRTLYLTAQVAAGCAQDLGMEGKFSDALAWLAERGGLITGDGQGGVTFKHADYRDYLAAEDIAARENAASIVKRARDAAFQYLVPLIAGFAHAPKAWDIVKGLLRAGRFALALEAAAEARYRRYDAKLQHVLSKVRNHIVGAELDERLAIVRGLANLDDEVASRLIVEAALPFDLLVGEPLLKQMTGDQDRWENTATPEPFVQAQEAKISGAYRLGVRQVDGRRTFPLFIGYGHGGSWGGAWLCAGLAIDRSGIRLPGRPAQLYYRFAELLSALLKDPPGIVQKIADAAAALPDLPEQTRVLALALAVERRQLEQLDSDEAGSNLAAHQLLDNAADLWPGLSPGFCIGLANAALLQTSEKLSPELRAGLLVLRRRFVQEYIASLRMFLDATHQFTDPPPPAEYTEEVIRHIRAALKSKGPSYRAFEEKQSFLERYVANSGSLIHKIKAKDSTGRWAYYFVLVDAFYEGEFMGALKDQKEIDLEDFGIVIASNYGEGPSPMVQTQLQEYYGFKLDPLASNPRHTIQDGDADATTRTPEPEGTTGEQGRKGTRRSGSRNRKGSSSRRSARTKRQ